MNGRIGNLIRSQRLPWGSVVETLHSQCRGPGFDPWSGKSVPHTAPGVCVRQLKALDAATKILSVTKTQGTKPQGRQIN